MTPRIRQRGFTLLEALVSSVVLCTTVALIGAISGKTLWQIRANSDSLAAWQILDEQMTTIAQMGLAGFVALEQTRGEVETVNEKGVPTTYLWEAQVQETSTQPGLFQLTLTLNWPWNGKVRQLAAATLMYDASLSSLPALTAEGDEGTDTGGGAPAQPEAMRPD